LSEQPLAETTFLDTGAEPLEPTEFLAEPARPLPSGSLSLWTELDAGQFLLSPREGVEAVVIQLDAESADDPVARILAVGGRSAAGSGAASYLATAESIAVYADGSLDPAWLEEAPLLNVPRSHYALLTTQGRDATDYPPEGEDPPCPDFDGDGYVDCACAEPDDPNADCDDNNSLIYPGATEICGDGIDQDCDGLGCAGSDLACLCDDDLDGDGHISVACGGDDCCDSGLEEGVLGCSPETAASIHGAAVEVCGDGVDQNCDGIDPECLCDDDFDGDGHISVACGGDDCCDSGSDTSLGCTGATASSIHPGAIEICGDGVDQNCDGADDPCIPVSATWFRPMTRPSVFDQGIRVPRTLKGGETVYVIAVMGDSDWSDIGNSGVKTFEACKVDENGRLVSQGGLWNTQKVQSNQGTFGHGAVLYYDYLFAFWGARTESYSPESSRVLNEAAMQRYSVAEAGDVAVGKEDELLTGSQSASAVFETIRSHYKMLRLMSYIYVIGGWADAHTDIDGNPVPAGPTGELERHVQ
jgi:hypothetical protein